MTDIAVINKIKLLFKTTVYEIYIIDTLQT